jgi:hypothetical protein
MGDCLISRIYRIGEEPKVARSAGPSLNRGAGLSVTVQLLAKFGVSNFNVSLEGKPILLTGGGMLAIRLPI